MPIPNPQINGDVRAYDTVQTVAINKNETDIQTISDTIGTPSKVGSILYRLGIIKDYVIEYGSNANGRYEKWLSGKLVQWGSQEFMVNTNPFPTTWGSTYHSGYFRITFPIPFVGDIPSTNIDTLTASGGQGWAAKMGLSTLTQSQECYYVRPNAYTGATRFVLAYISYGMWKTGGGVARLLFNLIKQGGGLLCH